MPATPSVKTPTLSPTGSRSLCGGRSPSRSPKDKHQGDLVAVLRPADPGPLRTRRHRDPHLQGDGQRRRVPHPQTLYKRRHRQHGSLSEAPPGSGPQPTWDPTPDGHGQRHLLSADSRRLAAHIVAIARRGPWGTDRQRRPTSEDRRGPSTTFSNYGSLSSRRRHRRWPPAACSAVIDRAGGQGVRRRCDDGRGRLDHPRVESQPATLDASALRRLGGGCGDTRIVGDGDRWPGDDVTAAPNGGTGDCAGRAAPPALRCPHRR